MEVGQPEVQYWKREVQSYFNCWRYSFSSCITIPMGEAETIPQWLRQQKTWLQAQIRAWTALFLLFSLLCNHQVHCDLFEAYHEELSFETL